MEAIFFACTRDDAVGVRAVDDLPCDPAGESVRIESPGIITALARALCGDDAKKVEPLRDATCQSFPVFEFASNVTRRLATLPDNQIDEVAERWFADESWQGADIDLYEISCLLSDVRQALQDPSTSGAGLFVLLEEKAI